MEAIRAKKRAQRREAIELGSDGAAAPIGQSAMDELDRAIESGAKPKGLASPGAGLLPASALDREVGMGAEGTDAMMERVERRFRAQARVAGAKSSTAVALAAELEAEQRTARMDDGEEGSGSSAGGGKGSTEGAGARTRRLMRGAVGKTGQNLGTAIIDATSTGGSAFSFGF